VRYECLTRFVGHSFSVMHPLGPFLFSLNNVINKKPSPGVYSTLHKLYKIYATIYPSFRVIIFT
jgi:hypothetical protein